MSAVVQTRLVRIGNSQGLRLPKVLIEQAGLGEEVEVEATRHQLIVRPAKRARGDWNTQFAEMAEHGDDRLLDDAPSTSRFDDDEWEW